MRRRTKSERKRAHTTRPDGTPGFGGPTGIEAPYSSKIPSRSNGCRPSGPPRRCTNAVRAFSIPVYGFVPGGENVGRQSFADKALRRADTSAKDCRPTGCYSRRSVTLCRRALCRKSSPWCSRRHRLRLECRGPDAMDGRGLSLPCALDSCRTVPVRHPTGASRANRPRHATPSRFARESWAVLPWPARSPHCASPCRFVRHKFARSKFGRAEHGP